VIILDSKINEDGAFDVAEPEAEDPVVQPAFNRYPSSYPRQSFIALGYLKEGDIIWDELSQQGAVIEQISVSRATGGAFYSLKSGRITRNFYEDEDSYSERITRLRDPEVLRDLEIEEVQRRYRSLVSTDGARGNAAGEPVATVASRVARPFERPVENIRVGDIVQGRNFGFSPVEAINEVGGFIKLRLKNGEIIKRRPNSDAQIRVIGLQDELSATEPESAEASADPQKVFIWKSPLAVRPGESILTEDGWREILGRTEGAVDYETGTWRCYSTDGKHRKPQVFKDANSNARVYALVSQPEAEKETVDQQAAVYGFQDLITTRVVGGEEALTPTRQWLALESVERVETKRFGKLRHTGFTGTFIYPDGTRAFGPLTTFEDSQGKLSYRVRRKLSESEIENLKKGAIA